MYTRILLLSLEHRTSFPSTSSSFANSNVCSILQEEKEHHTIQQPSPSASQTPPLPSILPRCIISSNLPRPILPRRRLTRALAPILLARSHPRIIRTLKHLRRRILSCPRITILTLTTISGSRFTLRLIIGPVPW